MKVELTEQQGRLVREEQGRPVIFVDPATGREYALITASLYGRLVPLMEQERAERAPLNGEVPLGIRRSQAALLRDLPDLLKQKRLRDQWVCYHGDERIGIARTKLELMKEVNRRGIRDDAYYVSMISPAELADLEEEALLSAGGAGGFVNPEAPSNEQGASA